MECALNEIKLQAKKLLKHAKNDTVKSPKIRLLLTKQIANTSAELKLKHCLHVVSVHFGFINWHHCQLILSGKGELTQQEEMGTFFYNNQCGVYINQWFSSYDEAKKVLCEDVKTHFLLPYKTQFIIVKREYLNGLIKSESYWDLFDKVAHNLYQSYNTEPWDKITFQILKNNSINH